MAPMAAAIATTIYAVRAHAGNNSSGSDNGTESNAFSSPFTTGIQIVQTVALGVLLVMVSITFFYCRDKAMKVSGDGSNLSDEKLTELIEKVTYLKGVLVEVGDAVERLEVMSRLDQVESKDYEAAEDRGECRRVARAWGQKKLVDWRRLSGWEGDVLRQLRRI